MTRRLRLYSTLLGVFLIFGWGTLVYGWETGLELGLSSLNFHPDRTPTDTSFSAYYFPLQYKVFVVHQLDENMSVDLTYAKDKILRNVLYGNFSYGMDYFSLQVGPFLGVGNSSEVALKLGILASIEFRYPGRAFLQLRSGRSVNLLNLFTGNPLSGSVSSQGDFVQENNQFALGFYMRNTILSFYVNSKIYTEYTALYGTVSDSQTDYGIRTEVFQKNIPFRIHLGFSFRNLTRYFEDIPSPSEHTIGSLIFQTRLEYAYNARWTAHVDLESSIYSFGMNDLIGEFAGTSYLFTLTTGFRYRFN